MKFTVVAIAAVLFAVTSCSDYDSASLKSDIAGARSQHSRDAERFLDIIETVNKQAEGPEGRERIRAVVRAFAKMRLERQPMGYEGSREFATSYLSSIEDMLVALDEGPREIERSQLFKFASSSANAYTLNKGAFEGMWAQEALKTEQGQTITAAEARNSMLYISFCTYVNDPQEWARLWPRTKIYPICRPPEEERRPPVPISAGE